MFLSTGGREMLEKFRSTAVRVLAVVYTLCLGLVFSETAKANGTAPTISSPIDIGPYITALLAACVVPLGLVLVYKFGWRLFNAVLAFFSGRNRVKV
jgi:hypothetical protein